MSPQDELTISRILKVNHAGEYGAIRIYRAQLFMSKYFYPELIAFLRETLSHEMEHCRAFHSLMAKYKTHPCRAMFLWGRGGYFLGLLTALLGKTAIMVCTRAVERTVHAHLKEQLYFLHGKNKELENYISTIQDQELGHMQYASSRIPSPEPIWHKVLDSFIASMTELVIWLSTWGEVTRLRKTFRHSREGGNLI